MADFLVAGLLHLHLAGSSSGVPNPGSGQAPPGSAKVLLILKWFAWLVGAACVAGILVVAGMMALRHQRGEAGQHVAGLGWVLAAVILLGTAAGIVGALLSSVS